MGVFWGWTAYGAAIVLGLVMGHFAQKSPAVERNVTLLICMLGSLLLLLALSALGLWTSVVGEGYAAILGMFLLAGLGLGAASAWMGYLSTVLGWGLSDGFREWMTGDDKLKASVSFDRGDAAMKRGEHALALKEYARELERHPDEPELFQKMAEVHKALGDPGQGLACLREAARCAKAPHRRGPALLMLAEALGKAGDEAGRREALKSVLADPALSAYHAAARARNP